jgi:hypothetical protein
MRSRIKVWLNLVILGIALGRTYSAFQRRLGRSRSGRGASRAGRTA